MIAQGTCGVVIKSLRANCKRIFSISFDFYYIPSAKKITRRYRLPASIEANRSSILGCSSSIIPSFSNVAISASTIFLSSSIAGLSRSAGLTGGRARDHRDTSPSSDVQQRKPRQDMLSTRTLDLLSPERDVISNKVCN